MRATIRASIANILVVPIAIMVVWIAMLMGLLLVLVALLILVPLALLYCTIHPTPTNSWLLG